MLDTGDVAFYIISTPNDSNRSPAPITAPKNQGSRFNLVFLLVLFGDVLFSRFSVLATKKHWPSKQQKTKTGPRPASLRTPSIPPRNGALPVPWAAAGDGRGQRPGAGLLARQPGDPLRGRALFFLFEWTPFSVSCFILFIYFYLF